MSPWVRRNVLLLGWLWLSGQSGPSLSHAHVSVVKTHIKKVVHFCFRNKKQKNMQDTEKDLSQLSFVICLKLPLHAVHCPADLLLSVDLHAFTFHLSPSQLLCCCTVMMDGCVLLRFRPASCSAGFTLGSAAWWLSHNFYKCWSRWTFFSLAVFHYKCVQNFANILLGLEKEHNFQNPVFSFIKKKNN